MTLDHRRQQTDSVGSAEGKAPARALAQPLDARQDAELAQARPSGPEWPEVLRSFCERFATQTGHSISSVSVLLRLDEVPGEPLVAARLCEQIAADYGLKVRAIPSNHDVMVRLTRAETHQHIA
jgi:hypothetical protein